MFQVEGWIMPEMPGVMTDILISMDDRSRFPVFLQFSNTKLFWTLIPNRIVSSLQNEWGEQICWLCEFHQVPLLLQLAARRREAVRHHWHQVPWLPRTSNGISLMLRNPKLTGQIFFGGLIQAGGPVKVVEDKEMSVQPQVQMTITCLRKDTIMILHSDPICKRQEDWGRPTDVAGRCAHCACVYEHFCIFALVFFCFYICVCVFGAFICIPPSWVLMERGCTSPHLSSRPGTSSSTRICAARLGEFTFKNLNYKKFPIDTSKYRKHCQRHNGPEGWVHLAKLTSWIHITSSNTNLDHIFRISTKHQLKILT